MHYLTNLVDEKHDTLLEHLCGISEPTNVTKAENAHAFETGKQRVNIVTLSHILTDNFGASLAETDGHETADFFEGGLQHFSFERGRGFWLVFEAFGGH